MGFPYYGGSVINGYMIHEIPMSRSTLGLGFTFLNLFLGIAAIFVAMSIVKFGIRATFIAGSVLYLPVRSLHGFLCVKALALPRRLRRGQRHRGSALRRWFQRPLP